MAFCVGVDAVGTYCTLIVSTDPDYRLHPTTLLQLQAMWQLIPGQFGTLVRHPEEDVQLHASDNEPRFWGGDGSCVTCPNCTEDRTREAFSLLTDFHNSGYVEEPVHQCPCGAGTRLTHMQFEFCALAYFSIEMSNGRPGAKLPAGLQQVLDTDYPFAVESDDDERVRPELADLLGTQLRILNYKI